MADSAENKIPTEGGHDLGGLITFIPDVDMEWDLGFEIEIVVEGEDL